MQRPTGTVTFLFTDIAGSTRLWESHPRQMDRALQRHDELVRSALESEGGWVFKTVGDAFCTAFESAVDAVSAALAVQRAMRAEDWPAEAPIRVRVALCTGLANERDGDYFGPSVNRCARQLDATHPEQITVSAVTEGLVHDELPSSIRLLDLGAKRFRDLRRPEPVFQVVHEDLPSDFPPLESLDRIANNLPIRRGSFVGRERELGQIGEALKEHRLVTLTGPGGTGKTRLALQVAADVSARFDDGAWFVDLVPVHEDGRVVQAIASAMGVREEPGRELFDTLTRHLRPRRALIVLDNCEHLVDACARLTAGILGACSEVVVLATSRESMRIEGEWLYPLSPLSSPMETESGEPTVSSLTQYEAVRLFIDRALAVKPGFAVNNDNAPALAALTSRLDGIPLAIELAAARMRMMSVEDILRRLDQRFRLLAGGRRAALAHHQTLRAAIDWSHDLLDERERAVLRRLSVFRGGWDLASAEAVCTDDQTIDEWDVLDLLGQLVDKSLVQPVEDATETRYEMLQSLREYGLEKLGDAGESEEAFRRHLHYFLRLARSSEPELLGAGELECLNRLDVERDNLRVALRHARETGHAGAGLEIATALRRYWDLRGGAEEGRAWLETLLSLPGARDDLALWAKAKYVAGGLAWIREDLEPALALLRESRIARQELDDRAGLAEVLHVESNVHMRLGDAEKARELEERSLAIRRELGDRLGESICLNGLGTLAGRRGDQPAAREHYAAALEIIRELGNRSGEATQLMNIAGTYFHSGEAEEGRALALRSVELRREVGDRAGLAESLTQLGILDYACGDVDSALSLHAEALELFRELGLRRKETVVLSNMGEMARAAGDLDAAAEALEASLRMVEALKHDVLTVTNAKQLADVRLDQNDPGAALELIGMGAGAALRGKAQRQLPGLFESAACLFALREERAPMERCARFAKDWRAHIGEPLQHQEAAFLERYLSAARSSSGEGASGTDLEPGASLSLEADVETLRALLAPA